MAFFLGFVAGFVSAVAISALIIIIGVRKIISYVMSLMS